ncbi:MAG: Acyl-CoA dehydrogenase family protein [Myxococcales bacterium]|nr:Acyl-CoA dehydrogenase family protein [Myxococcales bacterium]
MANPLLSDRHVDFLLYEVLDVERLCALPAFADHGRETFDLFLASARRLGRELLYPSYRDIDAAPPEMRDGRMRVHPKLREIYPQLVALGLTNATRPVAVGGQQLPVTVSALATAYLMAGNLSAYGYVGLTSAAAHLIEVFGDASLKERFMSRMYAGEWTGTMALTEPHAGSSLADVTTRATPTADGHYLVSGSKIFISGGDHDLTDNVVHMTLGRIDGAPAGIKGLSLFAIPNRREGDGLVDNDVRVAGVIHKIGWRGLPSLILSFGERGDCRGWLVGEPNRGIAQMFQMMNEARIMVGMNAIATASVAYHESLAYAAGRAQGRPPSSRAQGAQVPIIEHADVRRMLLRQKAIVEGGLALLATTSLHADLAGHASETAVRRRSQLLLDLLTPVAKTFPAESGFESNALALQIHGGYGYSSEYLPEAWLRDQKLNTLHEGTSGIQGLDLLGRKVVAAGGEALAIFAEEVNGAIARARAAGVVAAACDQLASALAITLETTATLAARGLAGDVDGMLLHSTDYLTLFSLVAVGWQWILQAAVAAEALAAGCGPRDFYDGIACAAQYFLATDVPRVAALAALCTGGAGGAADDSYARMKPEWF